MSTTYIANIVGFLVWFAPMLGINLDATAAEHTVTTIVSVAAGLWIFYGRWKAGGIHWWGGKKVANR